METESSNKENLCHAITTAPPSAGAAVLSIHSASAGTEATTGGATAKRLGVGPRSGGKTKPPATPTRTSPRLQRRGNNQRSSGPSVQVAHVAVGDGGGSSSSLSSTPPRIEAPLVAKPVATTTTNTDTNPNSNSSKDSANPVQPTRTAQMSTGIRKSGAAGVIAATSDAGANRSTVQASDAVALSEGSSKVGSVGAGHVGEVEMGEARQQKGNVGKHVQGSTSAKAVIAEDTSRRTRRRSSIRSVGTTSERSAVAQTKVTSTTKKSSAASLGKAKKRTGGTSMGAANQHSSTRSTTRGASRKPHATRPPMPVVGATQLSATSAFDFDVFDGDDERDADASIAPSTSAVSGEGQEEGTEKSPAVAGARRAMGSKAASSTPAPSLAGPTEASPSSVFDFPRIGNDQDSNADASTPLAPGGRKEETEEPPTVATRRAKRSKASASAAPAAGSTGATASANISAKATPTRNRRSPRMPTSGQSAGKSSKEQPATGVAVEGQTESGKRDRQRTAAGVGRRKRSTPTNRSGEDDSDNNEEQEEHKHEYDEADGRAGGGSVGRYGGGRGDDLRMPQAAEEEQHEAVSPRSRLSTWLSHSKGYFESSDEEDKPRRESRAACWLLEEDCSSDPSADETGGEVGSGRGGARRGTKGTGKRPLSGDASGDTKRSGGRTGAAAASRRERIAGGTPTGRTKKKKRRATIGGAGTRDADTFGRKAGGGLAAFGGESPLVLPRATVSSPNSRRKSAPSGVKRKNVVGHRGDGDSDGKSGGTGGRADYEKQLEALRAMYSKVDSHQLTVTR